MSEILFTRSGEQIDPSEVRISHDERGKPFLSRSKMCNRCGGGRRLEQYRHVEGGICFQCNGAGYSGTEKLSLYTRDQLDKLNASQAKRNAAKVRKAEAEQAEADARREAFEAAHADVLPWLHSIALDEYGEPREGFLGDMLRLAQRNATWTEAQAAGVRGAMAKRIAEGKKRAASEYVGQLGERLDLTATVERESVFYREKMYGYGQEEEVFVTTLRDHQGNALVIKSASFRATVGSTISIRGTVKDHSEFRGEKQTVLSRVKEIAPPKGGELINF